jgi:hypothetical protein
MGFHVMGMFEKVQSNSRKGVSDERVPEANKSRLLRRKAGDPSFGHFEQHFVVGIHKNLPSCRE